MAEGAYRSPLRKLVACFQKSRDQWKEKCQQTKYQLKLLKRRFQNLQNNCLLWQQRCQDSQTRHEELLQQHQHLQEQHRKLHGQLDAMSKKRAHD